MKALVHDGNGHITLEDRAEPKLCAPGDAIVRVTLSTICTSDLHIIHGAVPRATPDIVLGHEFVGVVEQAGTGVQGLKPGDRVAVSCESFCGECFYCERGWVNNCVEGGWELGCCEDGCQAELVRVPFADKTCCIIPDNVSDEDALFLGDIVATGHWGARIAEIGQGSTVAVIGAGPVGLATMMCARLFEPVSIIAIDIDSKRLELAMERGLADHVIDAGGMNLSEIEAAVCGLSNGRGADSVIEAAGGANTFEMAWRIARPHGVVVLSAMYEGPQTLPLHEMYGKNLVFKTGGVDACNLSETMDLVRQGRIDTSCLISKRYALNDIVEAYRAFEAHEDGCLKIVVTPWEQR
ncbi:MAG: alcohol dehydrogenase [Coriobacteriaceae bacterium]|nr:alcohol dehydrogenase [Coriobacteriaceae bacterium]